MNEYSKWARAKTYIGSSVNFPRRLRDYYSSSYLEKFRKSSAICNALFSKGYSKFTLEILEYCEPSDVVSREQFYLDLFKPEYNILRIAGSSAGYKHSEETKLAISLKNKGKNHPLFGKKHSEEYKAKMSEALKGENHPMFGKTGEKHHSSLKIVVSDLELNTTTTFGSICEAARALNISQSRISMYFKNNQIKPYKGRYVFTKI